VRCGYAIRAEIQVCLSFGRNGHSEASTMEAGNGTVREGLKPHDSRGDGDGDEAIQTDGLGC
jgi:hypothetical protein